MSKIVIYIIELYRSVSSWLPKSCRYEPTCSEYMIMAIKKNGAVLGMLQGFGRILRCNQLFKGGYDPVR